VPFLPWEKSGPGPQLEGERRKYGIQTDGAFFRKGQCGQGARIFFPGRPRQTASLPPAYLVSVGGDPRIGQHRTLIQGVDGGFVGWDMEALNPRKAEFFVTNQ